MKKRFQKVAVLMGGPSSEREVSLRSGRAIAGGLERSGYQVKAMDVAGRTVDLPAGTEAVFIALHGAFGEDGGVQALLEERRVPYTGPGPRASRLAFDKVLSKELFAAAGVPTPESEVLAAGGRRTLAYPVVVKPVREGSSFGVHRVFGEAEWAAAFADALQYGGTVLVERYIAGRELTAGIVGREPLPVVEICAPDGCYDYRAKYTKGLTEYRAPAPLPADLAARCQQLALRAFDALGCRSLARVDFRLDAAGGLHALEINTVPGFTETSLLPKAAGAAGLPFDGLCARLMEMAALDTA